MCHRLERAAAILLLAAIIATPILQALPLRAQLVAPDLDAFRRLGEEVYTLEPALELDGHLYRIHYYVRGRPPADPTSPQLIGRATADSFDAAGVRGLLLTEDERILDDPTRIREVLLLYRAAYVLYADSRFSDPYVDIFDDLTAELRRVTRNPVFLEHYLRTTLSSWLSGDVEPYRETLRTLLRVKAESPAEIEGVKAEAEAWFDGGARAAEGLRTGIDLSDRVLTLSKYSNSKRVRDTFQDVRRELANIHVYPNDKSLRFSKRHVTWLNGATLFKLAIDLAYAEQLGEERAGWLALYEGTAIGAARFDGDQATAVGDILVEARADLGEQQGALERFVIEESTDWLVGQTERVVTEKWVKWSWQKYGKRVNGHLAAGAVGAAFLGYELSNLLYGLDGLFANFIIAEHADDLRQRFRAGREDLERRAAARPDRYDGGLAEQYRAAYLLDTLSAAQAVRAYSDGVDATLASGALGVILDIDIVGRILNRDTDWAGATRGLRDIANGWEVAAEEALGHPAFLDAAAQLAADRLATVYPSFGECAVAAGDGVALHTAADESVRVACVDLTDPRVRLEALPLDGATALDALLAGEAQRVHHPLLAVGADGALARNGARLDAPAGALALALSRTNSAAFLPRGQLALDDPARRQTHLYNTLALGQPLISDGTPLFEPCPAGDTAARCRPIPRAAIGLSADGRRLLVVAAQGSEADLGRAMVRHAAYQAALTGPAAPLWHDGRVYQDSPPDAALVVFREEIPRHDAHIADQGPYPLAGAGEPFVTTVTLRNSGFLTWEPGASYQLESAGGETFGIEPAALPAPVPPGATVEWTLAGQAPLLPNLYRGAWQLVYRPPDGPGEPIGRTLHAAVVVTPPGATPELTDGLRQWLDDLQQRARDTAEAKLDELFAAARREFMARLRDAIEQQLNELLAGLQCLLVIPLVGAPLARFLRRPRGRP